MPAKIVALAVESSATSAALHDVAIPTTRNRDGGGTLTLGPEHVLVGFLVNRDFSTSRPSQPTVSGWTTVARPTNSGGANGGMYVRQCTTGDTTAEFEAGFVDSTTSATVSRGNVMIGVAVVEGASSAQVLAGFGRGQFIANSGGTVSTRDTPTASGTAAEVLWLFVAGGVSGTSTVTVGQADPAWDFLETTNSSWTSNRVWSVVAADVRARDAATEVEFPWTPSGVDGSNAVGMTLAIPVPGAPVVGGAIEASEGLILNIADAFPEATSFTGATTEAGAGITNFGGGIFVVTRPIGQTAAFTVTGTAISGSGTTAWDYLVPPPPVIEAPDGGVRGYVVADLLAEIII